jgi:hypothetical protein
MTDPTVLDEGGEKSGRELDQRLLALNQLAAFVERSRLGEYVELLQRPWRLAWLSFLSGVGRGVGFSVGAVVVVAVLVLVLKLLLHHIGGIPWFGRELEQLIAWVLNVIERHRTA